MSSIIKATKKPVTIEAIRYVGGNLLDVLDFTGKHHSFYKWFSCTEDYINHVDADGGLFKIFTLEGTMNAEIGDYIIKGVQGEFYPCKPDIFHMTYDVEDN